MGANSSGLNKAQKKRLARSIRELMGETIHTSFRKGPCMSDKQSSKVWSLISKMDNKEWSDVVEWASWAMCVSLDMEKEYEEAQKEEVAKTKE